MEKINRKVEELRKNSKEFNSVLEEATSKIEELIKQRNAERSVRPRDSRDMKIRVKVTALPLTKEEMKILTGYIYRKYINDVFGNDISIRKSIFSNYYIIKSYYKVDLLDDEC